MATKKNTRKKTVRVSVPSRKMTLPPERGARLFKLTDDETAECADMVLQQIAAHRPATKKGARKVVVVAAVVAVEEGVLLADFLYACNGEYMRAANNRKKRLASERQQRAEARRLVARPKSK